MVAMEVNQRTSLCERSSDSGAASLVVGLPDVIGSESLSEIDLGQLRGGASSSATEGSVLYFELGTLAVSAGCGEVVDEEGA